jgi:hypothetical protein
VLHNLGNATGKTLLHAYFLRWELLQQFRFTNPINVQQ